LVDVSPAIAPVSVAEAVVSEMIDIGSPEGPVSIAVEKIAGPAGMQSLQLAQLIAVNPAVIAIVINVVVVPRP
jgi:hypothetical protein